MASGVLLLGPFYSTYYMEKDLDKVAAIEKAISKKFGAETIQNPNAGWDDDKEKEYLESSKKFQSKVSKYNEDNDLVAGGFIMKT